MSLNPEQLLLIRKLALLNAVKHNGTANPGSVISGLLGDFPELKSQMRDVSKDIQAIIQSINKLSVDEQTSELLKIDSSALDKKDDKRDVFDSLKIPQDAEVFSCFPPGPEKFPHIGHVKAIVLNHLLANKYNGKFMIRFEDTNPDLVKDIYYKAILDAVAWLGITPDEVTYASDFMDEMYLSARRLIDNDLAYVCLCDNETVRANREKAHPCEHRTFSISENLKLWDEMVTMQPGSATLRLKIDLAHKNSTMRDPALFRINRTSHARHNTAYSVWPTYDFQNSFLDGFFGITHRIRSKEFEMRNELHNHIQYICGFDLTNYYVIARFNLEGVLSSGRVIREKIENGELIGWDDPSLPTVLSLRRRGFTAQAISNFVVSTGISKSEATLTWDDIIIQNKRILDSSAKHLFFVKDPVKVVVEDAPKKSVSLKLIPNSDEKRVFDCSSDFFISKSDFDTLVDGGLYRFIELFNARFISGKFVFVDDSLDSFRAEGKGMLHYLPADADNVKISILHPDKSVSQGLAEKSLNDLRVDEVVQFERFGFARLDDKSNFSFWFTH